MDELTSTEFRKGYARLTESTRVTVNGHSIGVWIPEARLAKDLEKHWGLEVIPTSVHSGTPVSTQAQRDELLNKINRSR